MVGRRARGDGEGAAPARKPDPTPLDVAAGMLHRAPMSERELEDRLVAKGYRAATAATAVARCRELGWVGDASFADDRARASRRRGAGSLKIAAELLARGIPEAMVERVVEASLDGESEATWARRALDASGRGGDAARAWRFLASRGFPEDVVAELVELP